MDAIAPLMNAVSVISMSIVIGMPVFILLEWTFYKTSIFNRTVFLGVKQYHLLAGALVALFFYMFVRLEGVW
jgi:hypothetical protein